LTLCDADAQCSEICIVDGSFTWQRLAEPGLSSAATEAADTVLSVDHSDEDILMTYEAGTASDTRPTLTDINFTVPKVFNFVLRFISQT